MAIYPDYKKLLPASMRTGKWGEFIEAVQSVAGDVKSDEVEKAINQFDPSKATTSQLSDLATRFGWTIYTYEGWTSNIEYFRRQALTAVARIKYKNTRRAYKNEGYIFNLWADVFPLVTQDDNSLSPFSDFWTNDEDPAVINILDSGDDNIAYLIDYTIDNLLSIDAGMTLDMTYPIYNNPPESGLPDGFLDTFSVLKMLDEESFIQFVTRKILYNYKFKLVEDATNFLSSDSVRAMNNDLTRIKRITEQIYLEPIVEINYGNSNVLTTTPYYNYSGALTASQQTVLTTTPDNFLILSHIQLGSGILSNPLSATGVDKLVYTIDAFDPEITQHDIATDVWTVRKKLFDKEALPDFTEIACIDINSGCFLYSHFPSVNLRKGTCYSNVQFIFTEV